MEFSCWTLTVPCTFRVSMGRSKEGKKATRLLIAMSFASQRHLPLGCGLPKTSYWSQTHAQGRMSQGQALLNAGASFCTLVCPSCLLQTSPPAPWAQHQHTAAGKSIPDLLSHVQGPTTPFPERPSLPACPSHMAAASPIVRGPTGWLPILTAAGHNLPHQPQQGSTAPHGPRP